MKLKKWISLMLSLLMVLSAAPTALFYAGASGPDYLPGDVDGDKLVTAADVRLALRRAVNLESYPKGSAEYNACNVDGNDQVNAADARLIIRKAVDLETFEGDYAAKSLLDLPDLQNDGNAEFRLQKTEITEDTLTVSLTAKNCAGLKSADLAIGYDPAVLSFKESNVGADAQKLNDSGNYYTYYTGENTKGTLQFSLCFVEALAAVEGVNADEAVIASLKFTLLDAFTTATVSVGVKTAEGASPTSKSYVLPEPDYLPGDVNGDKLVTAADARLALRKAVGLEDYAEGSAEYNACNVNGDKHVTAADARLIIRRAVDLEIFEGAYAVQSLLELPDLSSDGTAEFLLKKSEIKDGKLTVSLIAKNCAGLKSADLVIGYDPAVLSFTERIDGEDAQKINKTGNTYTSCIGENTQGTLQYALYFLNELAAVEGVDLNNAILAEFSFDVKDTKDPAVRLSVKTAEGTPYFLSDHTHNYVETIIPATCTKDGRHTYTCECGDKLPDKVIPAKGHDMTKTEAAAPSCTAAGNKEYYTCSVCKKLFADAEGKTEIALADTVLPITEHQFGEGVVTQKPTAKAPGEMTYTCAACGEKKTEAIPQLTFTLGDVNGDGKITAKDARLALRRAVSLETYAEDSVEFCACDVNRDNKVNASDARKILRAAVQLEDPAKW